MLNQILLVLKGMAMGMAEAIPGVSGGTIAFITGIYEELINTIKSITPANLEKVITSPREGYHAMNGKFLGVLLLGMALGLVVGVLVLSELLLSHREMLWAFFFGIVLASSVYFAYRQHWNVGLVAVAIFGIALSYGITLLSASAGSEHYVYIFFAGCIAVSALMLPGLSGSFILLLLGLYETIIFSVKSILSDLHFGKNVLILLIFGSGVLVGLFSFARVLSYLFKHHYHGTMAFLIGILIGSLNKLWPWKKIASVLNKETGEIQLIQGFSKVDLEKFKIVKEINLLPGHYSELTDPQIAGITVSFLAGAVLIAFLAYFDQTERPA